MAGAGSNGGQGTPLGNLVVNLSLNGSQFTNSLQGIRGDLRHAQSAMKANLAVLGEAGNEYNKLSQHIEDLNKVMQVNERQINELRRKHQQMIDTYGEESEEAKRYAVQINRVVQQQANFQRQLRRTEQELQNLDQADTKKLQKSLRQVEVHLGRLREHAEEVSQALGTMAVPAAAFTGYATAVSTEMDKLKGTLGAGLGLTKAQSEEAGKAAGKIYAEGFGESLTEVGNAYKMVIQFMDLSGKEAEKATKYALGYAEATGDDVQEALRGADALMKHYGMTAEEAFNYLTVGAQNGLNKSNELADNTAEYAQLFKEGGYSAKEMFQILEGGLSAGAYNLDKVNDFVKEFGIRLVDGNFEKKMGYLSKETQNLFKEFQAGKATSADVFKSFQKDLQNMGDNSNETKAALADMFGGLGEDNALQVIQGLSNTSEAFDDVSDAANKAGDSLRDTNISNVTEGWRQIQDAIRPIGDDILEFAGNIMPKLADGAEKVSGWFEKLGDNGKFFSLAIAGIGAVAPIVAAVFVVISGALASFGSAISGIMASGVLTGILGALGSFAGIAAIVVAAVTAIILVFRDMWKNSEEFRVVIGQLWEGLKEFGSKIKELYKGAFGNLVKIFKEQILPVLQDFYSFIKENIILILQRLQKFWEDNSDSIFGFIKILKMVSDFLAGVFGPVFGVVFKVIFAIVKGYVKNIVNIFLAIIDILSGVIKFITGIFTGNWKKAWEGIKEIFKGSLTIILNLLSMFFIGKILGIFKGFASAAAGVIKTVWSKITGFFKAGLGKVKDLTSTAKNKIVDVFGLMGTAINLKFKSIITEAKKVPQKIMDGFSSMKTKLVNKMKEIGNGMKNGLIGGLNGMIDGVNWVLEKLGLSKFKVSKIAVTSDSGGSTKNSTGGYVPKYHNGTTVNGHRGGPALVNDSKGPKYQEAVILPNGEVMFPQGKNVMMDLPKGSHVIPGHATDDFLKMMDIPKYAKGTGLWEKVKSIGEGVWDALTDPIGLFKKVISKISDFTGGLSGLPKTMVKGAFNFATDKASEWFKKLMNSEDAQAAGAAGGAVTATSGSLSGKWRVASELMSLANNILPKFKGAVITSGLRPGARTAAGTLSDHATGKALDISGFGRNGSPTYTAIAEQFFKSPYVQYVIANNRWKWKNRFGWKAYPYGGHMNHTHISAFANGGIVDSPTYGVFGEAGKEALIPLSQARKSRGVQLLNEAATHFGKKVVDNGSTNDPALLEAVLQQNQILMALLQKDSNVYLDGKQVGKQVAPTVKREIETIDKRDKRSRGITS